VIGRFLDSIRRYGALGGSAYLIDRAAWRLRLPLRMSLHRFVAQPVPGSPRLPHGRGRGISIGRAGPGDPALAALDAPDAVARFRFGQGAICLVARKSADPVGTIWLAFDGFEEDLLRLRVRLAPAGRCAWDLGLYIDPAHRGGLAFARLWDAADEVLRERGIGWTLSRVEATNELSEASHRRLGARRIGSALIVRLGPIQLFLGTVPPFAHLSTGPGSVPVVRLSAPKESRGRQSPRAASQA
jgi:hypothetical protein